MPEVDKHIFSLDRIDLAFNVACIARVALEAGHVAGELAVLVGPGALSKQQAAVLAVLVSLIHVAERLVVGVGRPVAIHDGRNVALLLLVVEPCLAPGRLVGLTIGKVYVPRRDGFIKRGYIQGPLEVILEHTAILAHRALLERSLVGQRQAQKRVDAVVKLLAVPLAVVGRELSRVVVTIVDCTQVAIAGKDAGLEAIEQGAIVGPCLASDDRVDLGHNPGHVVAGDGALGQGVAHKSIDGLVAVASLKGSIEVGQSRLAHSFGIIKIGGHGLASGPHGEWQQQLHNDAQRLEQQFQVATPSMEIRAIVVV